MRDIETIDSELQLVAALRCAAREQGGPLPSIAVADAVLDERLAHRSRSDENPATGGQRRPVHRRTGVETRPGRVSTATRAVRAPPFSTTVRLRRRESGVLEVSSTKRVVRYSCPPRCFLKLSVRESQLSRADYPRPTGRKVP
jgi:hypothetical protein